MYRHPARDELSVMPRAAKRRGGTASLDAEKDFREFRKIDAEKTMLRARWDEIFNYLMPDRTAFQDGSHKRREDPVSSWPARCLDRGVGNMISALFPHERAWFEILAGRDIPEDQHDEVNESLEHYRDVVLDAISRSEYASELVAMMRDVFCSFGAMRVERGPSIERPLRIRTSPLKQNWPIIGPGGDFTGMMRRYEMRAADIEAEYAGPGRRVTIPQTLRDRIEADANYMADLLEVSRTLKDGHQRCTLYLFASKEVLMDYTGSDPNEPAGWIVTPWAKVAGQTFPPGPADRALYASRMLNHVEETDAKAMDRRLDPPMGVDINAQVNPSNFRPVPRAVIPYSSELLGGAPPWVPIPDGGRLDYQQVKEENLKRELEEILFATTALPPIEDSHGMTATETRARVLQKLREEGVDYGTINRSHGFSFVRRVVWVLQSWGEIPPALNVNGRLFKIRYAGPLATAQDADDAQNIADTVALSIASAGPELTRTRLRLEDVPAELVRKRNAPASLIRPEEEAAQMEQQQMAMQAAQVAAENGLLPQQGQAA